MPRRRRLLPRGREPLRIEAPAAIVELQQSGPATLAPRTVGTRMDVAVVIPWFFRGSGGHSTIANLVRGLEARGHSVSLWLDDTHDGDVDADFKSWFGPIAGTVHEGFGAWHGADVVVATGWQTAHRTMLLPRAGARAYLVQDHEPEFYGTSAERKWAEETYGLGLHCVCASPWLAELVRSRYGASASHFDLGVRHDIYRPGDVSRRDDLVLFYARAVTPRRAVPLGLLALSQVAGAEVQLFGEHRPLAVPVKQLGVLPPEQLAFVYREATVGVVLSLTNPSLVPTEMMACGLPVVDVASDAMLATFGADGPALLASPEPLAMASAVSGLLADPGERARRSAAGVAFVSSRTWPRAAEQLERGLREALAAD